MKHELVITFSTLGGSRALVISGKAKLLLGVACLGLLGSMAVMGVTLALTLSSLSQLQTQLAALQALQQKHLVQEPSVPAPAPSPLEMTIDLDGDEPGPSDIVENRILALQQPEPEPLSPPALRRPAASANSGEHQRLLNLIPSGSPLKNVAKISSYFGKRVHPILRRLRNHRGLDFAARTGTPVYATARGVVREAKKTSSGYGRQVVVEHGLGFASRYAHLSQLAVKAGDQVVKGTLIGQSGNSGRSTGPHLHYEVSYRGKTLDPLNFVRWSKTNFQAIFTEEKGVPWASLIKQSQWPQIASLPFSPKAAP